MCPSSDLPADRIHICIALSVAVGVEHEHVHPCDFAASPVWSNIFVLTQPTTGPPPLVHSVSFAS